MAVTYGQHDIGLSLVRERGDLPREPRARRRRPRLDRRSGRRQATRSSAARAGRAGRRAAALNRHNRDSEAVAKRLGVPLLKLPRGAAGHAVLGAQRRLRAVVEGGRAVVARAAAGSSSRSRSAPRRCSPSDPAPPACTRCGASFPPGALREFRPEHLLVGHGAPLHGGDAGGGADRRAGRARGPTSRGCCCAQDADPCAYLPAAEVASALMFTLDHDPVDGSHLIVAGGELDLAATSEMSAIFAMSAAGPQDAVVLDLIGGRLHRLQRARHDPARRPAARGGGQAAARRRPGRPGAPAAGDHRHRAALHAARHARVRVRLGLATAAGVSASSLPRSTSASATASRGGREVRVGDRDDAHPRGVGGPDAVLGVLDRGRRRGSHADPAGRLQIDVRRRLAARDLLRGDGRREAPGHAHARPARRRSPSGWTTTPARSGLASTRAAPPRARPAAAAAVLGSASSIASTTASLTSAGVSSTCRARSTT